MAKNIEQSGSSPAAATVAAPVAPAAPARRTGQPRMGRPPKQPNDYQPRKLVQRLPPGPAWVAVFLESYAQTGLKTKAAKAAGVTKRVVEALEAQNADFAEKVKEAHAEYTENLEAKLELLGVTKNNALAIIMRLKAELPQKYHDKAQIEATVKTLGAIAVVSVDQANALLREMLADATEATRTALAGASDVVSVGLADVQVSPKRDTAPAELAELVMLEGSLLPAAASKPA